MIFYINVDGNFTRNTRLVVGGHTTYPLASIKYSIVVSRDVLCIAFMVSALNYIDLYTDNIGNTSLNAPFRENICTVAGPEFGSDGGIPILIARALCGLRIGGATWRSMFPDILSKDGLGYTASKSDKDVRIKREVFPNGKTYYSMILVYVDETMVVSKDTSTDINYLETI